MSIPDQLEQIDHALTALELARILSTHKLTIYRLAQSGELPSFKIATCVRFDPKAVAAWMRAQAVQA